MRRRLDETVLAPREHDDPVGRRADPRHVVGDRAGEDHEPAEEREKHDARGCGEDSACSWHVTSPNGRPGVGLAVTQSTLSDLDAFVTRASRAHKQIFPARQHQCWLFRMR